jgi:flagellar protein FlaG
MGKRGAVLMGIEPVASSSVHLQSQKKLENDVKTHQEPNRQSAEERLSSPNLEMTKEQLEKTVRGLNEFLKPSHTSLHFILHEELDRYYVQLVDRETKEVIREIPPEKILDMYASILKFVGLLVDEKV